MSDTGSRKSITKQYASHLHRMARQANQFDSKSSANMTNQAKSQWKADTHRWYVHTTVIVEQPMNSYGGMRLSVVGKNRTFQIVEYATEEIRLTLARTGRRATITVQLVELESRGDAWRAVTVFSDEISDSDLKNCSDDHGQ